MRVPLVENLFKNGETPADGGICFFHRITITVFTVGNSCIAHEEICIHHSTGTIHFTTIIHTAVFGPAVFCYPDHAIFELDNHHRIILANRAPLVVNGCHGCIDTGRLAIVQHPAKPGNSMTAHIHQNPTAGEVFIVEPIAMRTRMFLPCLSI